MTHDTPFAHTVGPQFFAAFGRRRALLLAMLFLVALGLRVLDIGDPPMDTNPVKQYRSAMVARAMFYNLGPEVPQWKLEVAQANVRELGELVPPIMEGISAVAYRVIGEEALWFPRVLSVLAWLAGGFFLYLIATRIANPDAALISLAFYLLLPGSVTESRSFQPDPSMVAAMLASVYAILRHHATPSWRWLVVAACLSALAIMLKGVALFFTIGAFLALAASRGGARGIVNRQALTFVALSVAPSVLFYIYVISGQTIGGHTAIGFLPHLLLSGSFWRGWAGLIAHMVGFPALIAALLGVLILPKGYGRTLLIGLWVSYGVYGVAKTYHIYTHPYYQLPLVPVVALSLGPTLSLVSNWLAAHRKGLLYRAVAGCTMALALLLSVMVDLRRRPPDFASEVQIAEAIGEAVGHSTKTILLARYSGRPLRYHGQLSGTYWPDIDEIKSEAVFGLDEVTVEERLDSLIESYEAEYFVVRDRVEFERQADLGRLLRLKYPVLVESLDYVIFVLRTAPATR